MKRTIDPAALISRERGRLVEEIARNLTGAGRRRATATYAIGDIHGHATALETMLGMIADDARGDPIRIVGIGDVVDKGRQSAQSIEILCRLAALLPDGSLVCLRGNHEAHMLAAIDGGDEANAWLGGGRRGIATMHSYGLEAHPDALKLIPRAHVDWLRARPMRHSDDECHYVHAGFRPGVALAAQDPYDMMYIKEPFLSATGGFDRHVVHGHSPVAGHVERHATRTNVDTGCGADLRLSAVVIKTGKGRPERFLSIGADGQKPLRGGWPSGCRGVAE